MTSQREARVRQAAASAARLRARLGTSDPLAIARLLGVEVRRLPPRSRADADAGIQSEYLADPPTILVYGAADEALAVAHELFHHLECGGLPPLSGAQPTARRRIGRASCAARALKHCDGEAAARAFAVALVGEGDADDD